MIDETRGLEMRVQVVHKNATLRGTLGVSWNPNEAVFCVSVQSLLHPNEHVMLHKVLQR